MPTYVSRSALQEPEERLTWEECCKWRGPFIISDEQHLRIACLGYTDQCRNISGEWISFSS